MAVGRYKLKFFDMVTTYPAPNEIDKYTRYAIYDEVENKFLTTPIVKFNTGGNFSEGYEKLVIECNALNMSDYVESIYYEQNIRDYINGN